MHLSSSFSSSRCACRLPQLTIHSLPSHGPSSPSSFLRSPLLLLPASLQTYFVLPCTMSKTQPVPLFFLPWLPPSANWPQILFTRPPWPSPSLLHLRRPSLLLCALVQPVRCPKNLASFPLFLPFSPIIQRCQKFLPTSSSLNSMVGCL
eukprot:Gb_07181 [translate_table: standard]